ncbi:MAG: hypothetical protein M1829_004262 [Trizodia sp. TS-e1964]|nr:MAG: hypothetical protein M1829_004262 [Trizodia sp. TS-e1964]
MYLLSATMLGDNPEKSKNPLRKALRRRNAKTVQFTDPTYFEASDIDYSTEEDEQEGSFYGPEDVGTDKNAKEQDPDEITLVEPQNSKSKEGKPDDSDQAEGARDSEDTDPKDSTDMSRTSDESADRQDEATVKSRKGTVRNTDSFFKDENVETRKITLTPNLLRDDSSVKSTESRDKELKTRVSLDSLEKSLAPSEKPKEDRRRKEKKTGMLSGLFKRKDKKNRSQDEEQEDASAENVQGDLVRENSILKPSRAASPVTAQPNGSSISPQTQRQPSKLQKTPPPEIALPRERGSTPVNDARANNHSTTQTNPVGRPPPQSVRGLALENQPRTEDRPSPLKIRPIEPQEAKMNEGEMQNKGTLSAADAASKNDVTPVKRSQGEPTKPASPSTPSANESPVSSVLAGKPEIVKSNLQNELDHFRSSPDHNDSPNNSSHDSLVIPPDDKRDYHSLSESPVEVSPVDNAARSPPALVKDNSSQEEDLGMSPVSPPSSPDITDSRESFDTNKPYDDTPPRSTTTVTPTWSDASLRMYLENDNEIKDLLILVHDKSDVVPAGPDHPIMGSMFKEENTKLAEITDRLDNILGSWLSRKTKSSNAMEEPPMV